MSGRFLYQQAGTADSTGKLTLTFPAPSAGYAFTGTITAYDSGGTVNWNVNLGGQTLVNILGSNPMPNIQAFGGEVITLVTTNAIAGQTYHATYAGVNDTEANTVVVAPGASPQQVTNQPVNTIVAEGTQTNLSTNGSMTIPLNAVPQTTRSLLVLLTPRRIDAGSLVAIKNLFIQGFTTGQTWYEAAVAPPYNEANGHAYMVAGTALTPTYAPYYALIDTSGSITVNFFEDGTGSTLDMSYWVIALPDADLLGSPTAPQYVQGEPPIGVSRTFTVSANNTWYRLSSPIPGNAKSVSAVVTVNSISGTVPPGTYNLLIAGAGNSVPYAFGGTNAQSGSEGSPSYSLNGISIAAGKTWYFTLPNYADMLTANQATSVEFQFSGAAFPVGTTLQVNLTLTFNEEEVFGKVAEYPLFTSEIAGTSSPAMAITQSVATTTGTSNPILAAPSPGFAWEIVSIIAWAPTTAASVASYVQVLGATSAHMVCFSYASAAGCVATWAGKMLLGEGLTLSNNSGQTAFASVVARQVPIL